MLYMEFSFKGTMQSLENILKYICEVAHDIIRDYVLVIAQSITPRPFSSLADNGRGLILRAITKTLWYKLFITYSVLTCLTNKNVSKQ